MRRLRAAAALHAAGTTLYHCAAIASHYSRDERRTQFVFLACSRCTDAQASVNASLAPSNASSQAMRSQLLSRLVARCPIAMMWVLEAKGNQPCRQARPYRQASRHVQVDMVARPSGVPTQSCRQLHTGRWRCQAAGAAQGEELSLNAIKRREQELQSRIHDAVKVADLPALKAQLVELEEAASAEDLWEQRSKATAVLQALTGLREEVAQLERFCGQLEDLSVAVELMEMEVRSMGSIFAGLSLASSGWQAGLFCRWLDLVNREVRAMAIAVTVWHTF